MVARSRARSMSCVAAFLFYLACVGMIGAASGRAKRVVHFKITQADIAEIERSEAEGHQPWRSNPCTVAVVAAWSIEHVVNSHTSLPCKPRILSPNDEIFRFELKQHRHIDEISVRRFHWRDPQTGKTHLTVWWATEAVISQWPKAGRK